MTGAGDCGRAHIKSVERIPIGVYNTARKKEMSSHDM
jgi:hypothetical protein